MQTSSQKRPSPDFGRILRGRWGLFGCCPVLSRRYQPTRRRRVQRVRRIDVALVAHAAGRLDCVEFVEVDVTPHVEVRLPGESRAWVAACDREALPARAGLPTIQRALHPGRRRGIVKVDVREDCDLVLVRDVLCAARNTSASARWHGGAVDARIRMLNTAGGSVSPSACRTTAESSWIVVPVVNAGKKIEFMPLARSSEGRRPVPASSLPLSRPGMSSACMSSSACPAAHGNSS
jgi:hypothetical protein